VELEVEGRSCGAHNDAGAAAFRNADSGLLAGWLQRWLRACEGSVVSWVCVAGFSEDEFFGWRIGCLCVMAFGFGSGDGARVRGDGRRGVGGSSAL
jgi:hypothetical protein